MNMVDELFKVLSANHLDSISNSASSGVPIILQSFLKDAVMQMKEKSDLPRVYLLHYDIPDLDEVATYADAIGPDMRGLLKCKDTTSLDHCEYHDVIEQAHKRNLKVHPWTLRCDKSSAPFDTCISQLEFFLKHGVDGFFTETPEVISTSFKYLTEDK